MDVAPDSSVLVAAAIHDHPHHEVAETRLAVVSDRLRLVSHSILETFSTLTGRRYGREPGEVHEYIAQFLHRPPVGVAPQDYPVALGRLAEAEVIGGAVYDGLIALSASDAGLGLISLDRRARNTYVRVGVKFELLIP